MITQLGNTPRGRRSSDCASRTWPLAARPCDKLPQGRRSCRRYADPTVIRIAPVGRLATTTVVGLGCLAVLASGCGDSARPADAGTIQTLGVTGTDSGTPAIASSGARVVLSWTVAGPGGGGDVFVTVSNDGGRSFGSPVRVNALPGTVRIGGEQAPRVAVTARTVAVVWTARENDRAAIRLSASTDGGRTFGAPWRVHADGLSGTRGWPSVAIDQEERIHALWLDGRNAQAAVPMAAGAHEHNASGAMAEHRMSPRQDVYRAVIDHDGHITEAQVAASVCFCCKTAVAMRHDGTGLAAWRHVFPGGVRDIAIGAFAEPTGEAPPFTRVSDDGWKIDGCPEDGPAVAVAGNDATHIAWPTLVPGHTPVKGVFYAVADRGGAFTPRARLDDGAGETAAHPQIAVAPEGDVAVVWESSTVGARRILLRHRAPDGRWDAADTLNGDTAGTYPAVAASDGAWIVAWASRTTPNATIAVRRLAR